jgi:hypothetical protein
MITLYDNNVTRYGTELTADMRGSTAIVNPIRPTATPARWLPWFGWPL